MLKAMYEAGPDALRIPDKFHFGYSRNQLFEENPHLQSCQDQAEALVRASTEG
jgi:hypothetical protein